MNELKKLSLFSMLTILLLGGCSDDPKPTNEEELITTLQVTLIPNGGGTNVTLEFFDEDGDGAFVPEYSYTPSTGSGATLAAVLEPSKTYTATITLLNESSNPVEDITEEIEAEAADHLFCFTVTGVNLNVSGQNLDENELPVGLTSTWTTGAASTGTINIKLRHQPGTKTGACPGGGDTDIDVTFNIVLQ